MTTTLPTRSKDTIVANIAAGMQGRVGSFLNFALGSVFRAIAEAYTGVALWLQGMILSVLLLTRASTSQNSDLDTWMADFGLTRLAANAATGLVTLGRYTAGPSAPVVPVGANVKTTDGSLVFVVTADPTNGNYSATLGGYVMAPAVASIDVPVSCTTPGAVGNISIGAISLISSAVPGVDTATNAAPYTNVSDGEQDTQFRARFILYINSLAEGAEGAIGYAVESLQLGLQYTITETTNFGGSGNPGFMVAVDDGSGAPSSTIVAAAANAVNLTRAAGVRFSVSAPTLINAAVVMTVTAKTGFDLPTVKAAVAAALATYINGLGLGVSLMWSRLIQVAYDASPGVASVSGVTTTYTPPGTTTAITAPSDVSATAGQTIKSSGVTFN